MTVHVRPLLLLHRCAATATTLFAAWTHPALVRQWLFATAGHPLDHVTLEARPGGALRLRTRHRGAVVEHHGTVLLVAAPVSLAFTLVLPEAPAATTVVAVRIVPRAGGSVLALRQTGVPAACAHAVEACWQGALYGLSEPLGALAEAGQRASGLVPVRAG